MTGRVFSEIIRCRICGGKELSNVLDLGVQALGGRFPAPNEPDPPSAPLNLVRCTNCSLVQLRHSVDPRELYTYGYGYRSNTNQTMRGHLAGLAQWVEQHCALDADDVVVDVGSNDGTLLKSYSIKGLRRYGIDAIGGKFRDVYPSDILLYEGFFSQNVCRSLLEGKKAKAITSIAMFYDLESPNDFVAAIRSVLASEGIWVLEQSYLPTMLKMNSYDTVCHEHLEYYGLRQIERLAKAHGLRVFDVDLNAANGGSFRLAVCHENSFYTETGAVKGLRQAEQKSMLDQAAPYDEFASHVSRLREQLVELVDRERATGNTFYLYGASTKGNTVLQYCGLDAKKIAAAAERNSEKWGHRTPGTGIPIISEEQARAANPNFLLVLPWHFRAEFIEREAAFRRRGGKLVFPLPTLDVI
jgi:NDP-4-keto-2,6-dideoxyhexose 3-C-methyltransferase